MLNNNNIDAQHTINSPKNIQQNTSNSPGNIHPIDSHDNIVKFFKEQIEDMKERERNMKEEWKAERAEMKGSIELLLDKVGNITNNTINIKEQNIILNNFGKENMDYLGPGYYSLLLKAPFGAIPKLIQDLHFHPNHPENHNIKITNKKLPYAHVWQGDKWTVKDKKQVIEWMVDKGFNIIDSQFTGDIDNLDEYKKKRYTEFQNKYEKSDKNLHKSLVKDTELLLINSIKDKTV